MSTKKTSKLLLLILTTAIIGLSNCKKDPSAPDTIAVPGQLYVLTKGATDTEKVFNFINEINLPVSVMYGQRTHISAMPKDSSSFIFSYINKKPYTNFFKDSSTIVVSVQLNAEVAVSPRLYSIDKKEYQADWLLTEKILRLSKFRDSDLYGFFIYFDVPDGSEADWISKLKVHESVVSYAGPVFQYVGD